MGKNLLTAEHCVAGVTRGVNILTPLPVVGPCLPPAARAAGLFARLALPPLCRWVFHRRLATRTDTPAAACLRAALRPACARRARQSITP